MPRRLLVLALLLVGCSDLIAPFRDDAYDYRKYVSKEVVGIDTVAFHWPRELLPVRYWVPPGDRLASHLAVALARWQGSLLYGEFKGVIVADSLDADVIVQNTIPDGGPGFDIIRTWARASECSGETDLEPVESAHRIALPIRVFVWPNSSPNAANIERCYSITVTHEIGHSLGLLAHSFQNTDVMFGNPVLDGISVRDRHTVETVYHTPATFFPTNRR